MAVGPAPPELVRELLAEHRQAGHAFGDVWIGVVDRAVELGADSGRGDWRRAIRATRPQWRDAYDARR